MWDQRYSEEGFAFGTDPNDFLREQAVAIKGPRVLCLGEGEGRNAVWLAEQGHEVSAVDASSVGMSKAQALAAERGVSISTHVADLADFDLGEDCWDGIVSIFCHLPEPLRKQVHRRAVKALKPGGVILLEAYTPEQLKHGTGGPPVAELMMSLPALAEEFHDLEFLHARELEREVNEGRHHRGLAAVVQLLARKA